MEAQMYSCRAELPALGVLGVGLEVFGREYTNRSSVPLRGLHACPSTLARTFCAPSPSWGGILGSAHICLSSAAGRPWLIICREWNMVRSFHDLVTPGRHRHSGEAN